MVRDKLLRTFLLFLLPFLLVLFFHLINHETIFHDPEQPISIAAMVLLPLLAGLFTIFITPPALLLKKRQRFVRPWLPVILFFVFAFIVGLDDCACWLIGLPIFLIIAGIGGMISGYFLVRNPPQPVVEQTIANNQE